MTITHPMAGVAVARGSETTADTVDCQRKVLRQFRVVFAAVRQEFRGGGAHGAIGRVRVWALSVIAERPGIGMAEFAAALDICQPTASSVAKSLRLLGLIECRKGTADRRTVHLHLRPNGRATLLKSREVFSGPLTCALAHLGGDDLADLEEHLARLVACLRATPRADPDLPLALDKYN